MIRFRSFIGWHREPHFLQSQRCLFAINLLVPDGESVWAAANWFWVKPKLTSIKKTNTPIAITFGSGRACWLSRFEVRLLASGFERSIVFVCLHGVLAVGARCFEYERWRRWRESHADVQASFFFVSYKMIRDTMFET